MPNDASGPDAENDGRLAITDAGGITSMPGITTKWG